MTRRPHTAFAPAKWARLSALVAALVLLVAAGWTRAGRAASPTSGTVTSANTGGNPVTYTAGPFAVANPSGLAAQQCNAALQCDDFKLKVDVPDGLLDTKQVRVTVEWANSAADFDISAMTQNADGTAGARVASSGTSADPEVMILPAVKADYVIRVVPFNPLGQSITTKIIFEDKPANFTPGTGAAPQYVNYPATGGLGTGSGEPSLGVNWKTGNTMFIAGLETLRVKFDDTVKPARATWEDKSALLTSLATTDPILYTDSRNGRTIVSQLTGTNSLSAFTDDDGETWVPNEGGPLTSGVDHQTVGGGPYAPPLTGGTALYPNAIYYCSQDLYTAFCARSDDGGLTYGPTVPMYTLECGGIHGHVKVAPDGTVYMPNRQCGTNQGVAVSEDNGITWIVRKVADGNAATASGDSSPGDWDPSVGVGSDGTLYFGYDYADGRPHVAVSYDKGQTWATDQSVGRDLNLRDSAFPAVVAGDGNRAAFAFLGTTELGGSQAAVWHLYVSTTYDRGRTWTTVDATPNDPVQLGTICSGGLSCGGDRNLLDFMDVQIDAKGRVLVGYADGCIGCSSPATSRAKLATIARLQCGRGLLAQFDSVIGECAAPTPTPVPTPAPTPASYCDGTNLVTDAAGDAKNPAPGAQGPTDQADITSISFARSGSNIVTKLTLKNLSATPSPGTTFTTYYVSWKAPNGVRYASQADVDASGLVSYGYGPYDGSQISTYTSTTGTFTAGANGSITVDVPLAGVGNPSVPASDPNQAAVSEPAAATIAGEGALGAGLLFTAPMDTATANVRWAVCAATPTPTPTGTATPTPTPTTTPTPSNDPRCASAGGLKVLDDPAADNTGGASANKSQDIRSISIAEQYNASGGGQLIVTMKVTDLTSTLTPNASWKVAFDGTHADGTKTTYFVSVANNSAANPTGISYNYGFVDTTKNNLNSTVGTADSGSMSVDNDTLTVVLSLNKLNKPVAGTTGATLTGPAVNLSAGKTLTGVAGTTSVLVGVAGNGLNSTIDTTSAGAYTMAGAATCPAAAGTPTPTPVPGGSATAPRFVNYVTPAGVAEAAGEPSIGVNWKSERSFSNSSGSVPNGGTVTYFGGFLPYMLRATFDDSVSPSNVMWDQAPLTVANAPRLYGDPILFTDPRTGRTFVSQELGLTPLGSTMEFTDDDGRGFRPSEGSGAPSGIDHQTVGGGPYHQPLNIVTNPVYPNAVYYCSQALETATCSLSVDGGMTFGPGVPMYTFLDCGGIHGHVKVGADGTVYVPNRSCGGKQGLAVSKDNGLTWKVYRVADSTAGDTDPSVGIATDGTVYFGYEGADGHARISVSRNSGETWGESFDVGAAFNLQNIVFPATVAGDSNRAAFAFHGTTTAGSYNDPNFPGVWYLYVATTFDGGKTWTTTNATPNDPVQRGAVCTAGINCTSTNGTNTRNLLDFFDATVDKEGRVLIGYVDGCVGSCVQGGANSGTAKAVVARQSGGNRMFAAYDPPAASAPSAPAVSGGVSGSTANLSWSAPDNGGAAITGYRVARRDGATVTPLANVTGTSYADAGYNATAQSVYRVTAVNANGESAYKEFNPAGAGSSASPCAQPGVLVVSDVNNDGVDLDGNQNTPPDPRANIKGVYVAEPYMGAGASKLVFTLKVAPSTAGAPPPSTQWYVIWNRPAADVNFDRWYVAMKSDAAGNLSFEYGKMGVPTNTSTSTLPPDENPNTNQTFKVGDADGGSYDAATGTITITLSTSKAEGIGAGYTMKGVNARTFFMRPDGGLRSQNVSSDITGDGTYTLVGNNSCASAAIMPAPSQERQGSLVEVAWASLPAALTRLAAGLAL